MNKQTNISIFFWNQDYDKLISFYEQQIENENDNDNYVNYIYLGLAYLLSGKEVEAQTAWFYILTQNNKDYQQELIKILDEEATNQEVNKNYEVALLIRNNLREIDNQDINNILGIINLEFKLNIFQIADLDSLNIINLITHDHQGIITQNLLLDVLMKILEIPHKLSLDFLESCLQKSLINYSYLDRLIDISYRVGVEKKYQHYGIDLLNVCLKYNWHNNRLYEMLSLYYHRIDDYKNSLFFAQKLETQSDDLSSQINATRTLLNCYLNLKSWNLVKTTGIKLKNLLLSFIAQSHNNNLEKNINIIHALTTLFYLEDNPQANREIINNLCKIFPNNHQQNRKKAILNNNKILKIGYIGHTFKTHAVGFLCRWLIRYHDRSKFEINLYFTQNTQDDFTVKYFTPFVNKIFYGNQDINNLVQKIQEDEIDILVDIDSFTDLLTSAIVTYKSAPIQVTWLGLDATGIPAIDYFIVDRFVLPEDAQDYYREKLWRLPHCYIGVDGYEVGIPSISKSDLGIEFDAITYLTIQTGWKRNQDWLRKQMQILKQVNNSYLLIQCNPNHDNIHELLEEEGINPQRIKFLPFFPHDNYRANLRIADILLDNYPFNGATTTIDALWMEIPLITKVGQQYHARQGYTLLKNVGVDEGIAWSDEEYIDWGVKLGKDENLRQEIAWKLKQSKKTSPLWNGKQFAREMENAYQQMWNIYCQQNKEK